MSLVTPHQMRVFGVVVDDCVYRYMALAGKSGGQCMQVGKTKYPTYFNAWKFYFQIQKPTSADLAKYLILKLTSTTYEPQHRYSRRVHHTKLDVDQWRACLVFPKIELTNATLTHNTNMFQISQSKTREYMQYHYKTSMWTLILRRTDDIMYSDTFFANITTIRGYGCFQMFAYKCSKFERIELVRREANAPDIYDDIISAVGAPNKIVTDNCSVLTGLR